jgi:cation diffusion facilitator family transporter
MAQVNVQLLDPHEEVECWRPFALRFRVEDAATGQPVGGLRLRVRYQRSGDDRTLHRDEFAEMQAGVYSFPMRFSRLGTYAVGVGVHGDHVATSAEFQVRAIPMRATTTVKGSTYQVQADWLPGHIHSHPSDEVRLQFAILRVEDDETRSAAIEHPRVLVTSDELDVRDELSAEAIGPNSYEARRVFRIEEVGPTDVVYDVAFGFHDPEGGVTVSYDTLVFPLPVGPEHNAAGDHQQDDRGHAHAHPPDGAEGHDHGDHGHSHASHDHGYRGHSHGQSWWSRLSHEFRPHSHDATEAIQTAEEATSEGVRAAWISLGGMGLTAFLQIFIVAISGSTALLADTVHNFGHLVTTIPIIVAFRLGRRPPTKNYPFGYRRAEDLVGLLIAGVIAVSAGLIIWESINALIEPRPLTNLIWVFAAGIVGFLGNEIVAIYRIRTGRKIGSAALIAEGNHARADGLTSIAVALGIIGVWLGFPQADAIVGLLIALLILAILVSSLKSVGRRLMDGVDDGLVDNINAVVSGVPGVEHIDEVRARWSGHRLQAQITIGIDATLTVAQGHGVAEQAHHALLHQIAHLDDVSVHIHPSTDGATPHAAHELTGHHA